MHIYLSTRKGIRAADASLNGSFRSSGHSDELDLGKMGYGEVEYSIKVSYQFSVELASIQKSSSDWFDDGEWSEGKPKSKNPPWDAIERAITRIINSSEFKARLIEAVGENVG